MPETASTQTGVFGFFDTSSSSFSIDDSTGSAGLIERIARTSASLVETPESTAQKILSFAQLDEGWHYGEGVPAASDVTDRAIELHDAINSVFWVESDASPSPDGSVILVFYRREVSVRVTVTPDLNVNIAKEVGTGLDFTREVVAEDIESMQEVLSLTILALFGSEETSISSWHWPGYSTPTHMNLVSNVSGATV